VINGIGFEFPRDASDQWDGFNDAGMEHFAGSPYLALGREIPQNVVDATDLPPARIVVRLIQVDTQSIPNFAEFRAALLRCQEIASDESDKARIFFDQAMELIAQRKTKATARRGERLRPACAAWPRRGRHGRGRQGRNLRGYRPARGLTASMRNLANWRYASTVGSGFSMSHQSGRPGSSICNTKPAATFLTLASIQLCPQVGCQGATSGPHQTPFLQMRDDEGRQVE